VPSFYGNRTPKIVFIGTGTAMSYGLDGRGTWVQFSAEERYFSLLRSMDTDPGARSASYPVGTHDYIPGVKRQGREAHHSPPSNAEVENSGDIPFSIHFPYFEK
jgi:hypothetical protein